MAGPFYPLTPLFSQSCSFANHLSLSLEHFQGWGIRNSSGQPVLLPHHLHGEVLGPQPHFGPKGDPESFLLMVPHHDGFFTWTLGLRVCWDSPWQGLDKVLILLWYLFQVPVCDSASLCSFGLVKVGLQWADGSCDEPGIPLLASP